MLIATEDKFVTFYKAAYNAGMYGFRRNKPNPFKADTMKAKEWERGYNAAFYSNLERVKEREHGSK